MASFGTWSSTLSTVAAIRHGNSDSFKIVRPGGQHGPKWELFSF
jgi:hypothetical protein